MAESFLVIVRNLKNYFCHCRQQQKPTIWLQWLWQKTSTPRKWKRYVDLIWLSDLLRWHYSASIKRLDLYVWIWRQSGIKKNKNFSECLVLSRKSISARNNFYSRNSLCSAWDSYEVTKASSQLLLAFGQGTRCSWVEVYLIWSNLLLNYMKSWRRVNTKSYCILLPTWNVVWHKNFWQIVKQSYEKELFSLT